MHILVATDLTPRSEHALARGARLARELDAALTVAHVVDGNLAGEQRRQSLDRAKRSVEQDLDRLAGNGVRADIEVLAGEPRAAISRTASARGADLIVLGSPQQPGRPARPFAETTAGAILKSTLRTILVVRGEAAEDYRRALVGVDFSLFSLAAIRQAATVAPHAELHLVHAYHVPFSGFLGNTGTEEEVAYAERLELDAFLRAEMAHLEQRAAPGAVPSIRTHLEQGTPTEVLRRACGALGAELLVIGTHSRPGISRAIFGSVATDLLGDPPCDVLVVKPFLGSQQSGD